MDAEASRLNDLPAFGSAIFNFNSAMNNPRISVHVSVLFMENAKEEEETLGAQATGVSEMVKE